MRPCRLCIGLFVLVWLAPTAGAACDFPDATGPTIPSSAGREPDLVWTGTEYGLAWKDSRTGKEQIYFTRLDAAGAQIGDDIQITFDAARSLDPTLVWTGMGFGLSWRNFQAEDEGIYFVALDDTGNKLGPEVLVVADGRDPELVWTGNGFGLAWGANTGSNSGVFFARLNSAGSMAGGTTDVSANTSGGAGNHSLVWNGSGYALAWQYSPDVNGIFFARLNSAGHPVGETTRVTSTNMNSLHPSLVWTGTDYAIAWRVSIPGDGDVFFARLDADGVKIGGDLAVSSDPSFYAIDPELVWTGSEFGIAWSADVTLWRTHFSTIDATGTVVGADVTVTTGFFSGIESMVWSGSGFGVASHSAIQIGFNVVDCDCPDGDGDGTSSCQDCDDANPFVYLGAPEICDGLNNDCSDPGWPSLPSPEIDDFDGDGFTDVCDNCPFDPDPQQVDSDADSIGDVCDNCPADANPDQADADLDFRGDLCDNCLISNPDQADNDADGAGDVCDPDDDNDSILDEVDNCPAAPNFDQNDDDADSVGDVCDNCPLVANTNQIDADGDGFGSACDNCPSVANAAQLDPDFDTLGSACDNCPDVTNASQEDDDGDGRGNVCDNCIADPNPAQSDLDSDFVGDRCDDDDGVIYIWFDTANQLDWQSEGFAIWNAYRGDLNELRISTIYTQAPGSNALAAQMCGLISPGWPDSDAISPGLVAFYLATGGGAFETDLGQDGSGNLRPNDNPCP